TILLDASIDALKRRFLRSRRVTLVTAAERLDLSRLAGALLVTACAHRTTVEVSAGEASIGALVDAVLLQTTLRDMAIEDPPLDEVIRDLYAAADTTQQREQAS